jgi:hypothetical protein
MKSSLQVREKPGIAGGAARVRTNPVEITAMAFENMVEAESGRVTAIRRSSQEGSAMSLSVCSDHKCMTDFDGR